MGPVIVFDGYCNLCNGWVSFVLSRDRRRRFRFAALQGDAGRSAIAAAGGGSGAGDSVILVENGRAHDRSTAALRIMRELGFPWSMAAILLVVPRPLRDAVYDFVARNRYRWFGRRPACRVATAEERDRFL